MKKEERKTGQKPPKEGAFKRFLNWLTQGAEKARKQGGSCPS
ncbi:hypothetical protein DENIS_2445 [Desulfonema ishimotonii]|uniref:Uncharacterized protein n=1 Tax=Desulfonema ishimotonii TaxID=45657 RepID=A0A401FX15_9BACT|nr:hypothetical protein [Desulfonema ishimotonii]GBC61483.1 hypothetical protein DENIS_2445 [Desulfonema ishimotonii]